MTSFEWMKKFVEDNGRLPNAIEYAEAGHDSTGQCDCSRIGDCVLRSHPQMTVHCDRQCYAGQLRDVLMVSKERATVSEAMHKRAPEESQDRMLKWFAFEHLPPKLKDVSRMFHSLATDICKAIEPGPERTVALRKLLESKDAAVRAALNPGG